MKSAPILLVALGLIFLYIVLSDKYSCFTMFAECLTGTEFRTPEGYTAGSPATNVPQVPKVPSALGNGDFLDQVRCFFTPGGC